MEKPAQVSQSTRLPLQQRICEQFGHVFWAEVCEVGNLVPATCARGDDFGSWRLIIDIVEQALGDLDRKIVFLCERAECTCHPAAGGIEHCRFSAGQTFRESAHKLRVHD